MKHSRDICIAAVVLVAAGCGGSSEEPRSPAAAAATATPAAEEPAVRFEPGHSKAVRDYYGAADSHDDDGFEGFEGESEAEYRRPPQPATGRVGDVITLTGTNLGVRLRVRVTDVSRVAGRLAVHLALENTGVAVFEAELDDARVTYGAGRRARAVLGVKAPCSNGFQDYLRIEPLTKRRGCLLFAVPEGARARTLQLSLEQVPVAAGGRWTLR